MNLLGLATLAFLQAAMPGSATNPVPEEVCYTQSALIGFWTEAAKGAHVVDILTGDEAQRFIQVYDAEEPKSHTVADEVLVMERDALPTHEDGNTVLIMFFKAGCRVGPAHAFPPQAVEYLYTKALGFGI